MACSHCKPWLWQRGSPKMCTCHVLEGTRVPNTAPVTLLHNREHLVKCQKELGRKRRKGEMSIFENEQITQTIILKSGLKGEVVRNFLKKSSILKQEQEASTTNRQRCLRIWKRLLLVEMRLRMRFGVRECLGYKTVSTTIVYVMVPAVPHQIKETLDCICPAPALMNVEVEENYIFKSAVSMVDILSASWSKSEPRSFTHTCSCISS